MIYDLIVVGGGPAGTATAITCARHGARVLLLERGRFPRHKVCGEFVSAESLDLLGGLLSRQHAPLLSEAIRIPCARMFLDGHRLDAPVKPPAASIARFDLDAALWESAQTCGVDCREQTIAQSISGNGEFRVLSSAEEFCGRSLVNASGRWSNLRPAASETQVPGAKWIGLKGHFCEAAPPASVDLYFFDGGYCGVQPVVLRSADDRSGRINACAMVRADVASTLSDVFLRHPALRERSRSWEASSDPVSTAPLVFRDPQAECNGVLMAGDAAAFVDPFVGDGISLALRSGAMAAESLIPFLERKISLMETAQKYRLSYEKQLSPIFRTSSRLRHMLTLPQALRRPLLSIFQKTPSLTRYLVNKTR